MNDGRRIARPCFTCGGFRRVCHGSGCRGRAPAASPARHGAGRWCRRAKPLTRGFGERPRISMQRDMPLPRIQPAHGWAGSMGQARPSSWCRARKPDCRCNGTHRCRASNPRRVGEGRRNRAGFLVVGCTGGAKAPLLGRDATGGRSASLAKVSIARPPCRGAVDAWRGNTAPNLLPFERPALSMDLELAMALIAVHMPTQIFLDSNSN